ncbi:MAG: hypothetical protein WBL50_25515 [Candidatus Acidiferrum sp.]
MNLDAFGPQEFYQRTIAWKHNMDLVSTLDEAREYALQAAARAIEIGGVVDRKDIHLDKFGRDVSAADHSEPSAYLGLMGYPLSRIKKT